MRSAQKVLLAIVIGFSLIFAMVLPIDATPSLNDGTSSYAPQLVLQLNKSPDPIRFWNELTPDEQEAIANSLVAEVECETKVIENCTRDDDFNEITVVVSGYYYGAKVWEHQHTVGWWYDYTYVNSWYRYSNGSGAGYGALLWVYVGEIASQEDYHLTYLNCMSKGYWEVQLYPGIVVNTFDHTIETTHYADGTSI